MGSTGVCFSENEKLACFEEVRGFADRARNGRWPASKHCWARFAYLGRQIRPVCAHSGEQVKLVERSLLVTLLFNSILPQLRITQ